MIPHATLSVDPRAEALIFDVDGTLLDTMPIHRQAWQETMEQYAVPFTDDLFAELSGLTTVDIVAILNERFHAQLDSPLDATVLSSAKDRAYLSRVPLIQPIGPVLDLVHRYQAKIPIGAATNETFGLAHMVLRSTGMIATDIRSVL